MPDPSHVIWVGAAGTATAFGLIRSARDAWGDSIRVVAADINPSELVPASRFADAFERVRRVDERGFGDELVGRLVEHGVDTYVPVHDREIVVAAQMRDAGRIPESVSVVSPAADAAERCLDKLACTRWLEEAGLPVPPTELPGDFKFSPPGAVLKDRHGVGSIEVHVIRDAAGFDRAQQPGDADTVAQLLCDAPEVTIDAFHWTEPSLFRAVCRERIEVKAGVCTKARLFENRELSTLAERVGSSLDLRGAYCVQVMRLPSSGRWAVIDVNPRPGGGTRMSAIAGVDLASATLAGTWGLDPAVFLAPLSGECHVVRHYEEILS